MNLSNRLVLLKSEPIKKVRGFFFVGLSVAEWYQHLMITSQIQKILYLCFFFKSKFPLSFIGANTDNETFHTDRYSATLHWTTNRSHPGLVEHYTEKLYIFIPDQDKKKKSRQWVSESDCSSSVHYHPTFAYPLRSTTTVCKTPLSHQRCDKIWLNLGEVYHLQQ